MISVEKVVVRFGGFELLKGVTFMIDKSDKLGLVGKNGAGKSTLLKMLKGLQEPSEGGVTTTKDITIGYLPQTMVVKDDSTVYVEAKKAFEKQLSLEKQINDLTNEIATRTDFESDAYAKLIEKLSVLNEEFQLLGGGAIDADVERTLKGLGFESKDMDRPTGEFSGGWRMRIELAKILLQRPDVLLLDEPTNHLDIESIQWLEDFLKAYKGAVVLISHDKRFLDTITNRTIEISLGKVHDYRVPYSKYRVLRRERYEQQLAAYKNQQKMIEETEDFIERFRYKATKAVQVQSRIKQLEKIDRIEIEEEDNSQVNFSFQPAPRAGSVVVKGAAFRKAYGDHVVLNDIDFELERGAGVAFVGRNGEGKSTFAKAIVGELQYEGELKLGHNVSIGYFAQEQDKLMDESKTVFETLDDVAVGDIRTKVRDILGAFLFSGEDVDKKVKVLSGGERSRLAMAKLLLQPYNLLVLDEPTNHLDMKSKDVLKQALLKYDGAMIIVSHDRDFLDGLLDTIYEFRNQSIKQYHGGIEHFLKKRRLENMQAIEQKKVEAKQAEKSGSSSDNKERYEQRKEIEKQLRKLNNRIKTIETKIEELEEKVMECDERLANPDGQELDADFFKDYENTKAELEQLMEEWEGVTGEQEELVAKRDAL